MKKLLIALSIFCLMFQACDKEEAATEGFDFSTTLPPYVELTSTAAKTVKQGTDTTVTFQMRSALQQAVTIYYNVTGAVNMVNKTAVIDRNKLSVVVRIAIPNNVIVAPATTATATLNIVKATTASGTDLTIGQKNTPATQKVTFNIIK